MMAYTDRPIGDFTEPVVAVHNGEYHDRVRWGQFWLDSLQHLLLNLF